MVNRPTSQELECLESTNDQHHSPLRRPKRASRIFGRPFSFSSDSSRFSVASIQTVLHPPTGLGTPKPPISPTHGVVSILNNMYANPTSRGRVDSHPGRLNHSTIHLGGHIGGSISIATPVRGSIDSGSQKSKGNGKDTSPSNLRKYPHAESSTSGKVNPEEMRSGASISSGSTGSSTSMKNSSTSSQASGSSLRVVGRGGSGSKLRFVAPQLSSLDPATLRQEHPPPLVRPSGRGGLASRPKLLEAPPPKPNVKLPAESGQPSFVRPSGRGGFASRPKPIGSPTSPPLFRLLKTKSKSGVDKGKRRALEPIRAIHPLPPNLTYQISNGSNTTLSSLHFVDETGEPSTPFFPDDHSFNCDSHSRAVSSPLSGSSRSTVETSDHSSSKSSILSRLSDHTAETTEEYCDPNLPNKPTHHRQRNLLKIARTLGYNPDDTVLLVTRPTNVDDPASSPQRKERNVKASRRASISVTSLASIFVKSGAGVNSGRDSVATSMMTDDLHHFGLEDELSDSWGNTSTSSFCERTYSPIVFSPPSPAQETNPHPNPLAKAGPLNPVAGHRVDSRRANHTEFADTESVSSSTLTCSEYDVFTPSQRPSTRSSSHSRQSSTAGSALSDLAAESNKSIWLIPVKDDDEYDIRPKRYRSATPTSLIIDQHVSRHKSEHWSGEWNEDIHQVIKSLRLL